MRLNAINPSDNPMEELLFCFGGDGDSGDSGSDSGGSSRGTTTSSRGSSGGTRGRSSGNDSSRDSLGDSSISSGYGGYDGGGGDGNDNRSTPAQNFAPPSFSPTTISRDDVAIAAAQDRSRSQLGIGGGDGGSPVATPVATAPVAPSLAPNLINQPLTVGGAFVAPYDSFQRSPQQMFGYGGLTAAPYSPNAISFQGGAPAASFSPLGAPAISQFDMGRAPTPAGVPDNRSFFDRVAQNLGGVFDRQEQRAGVFDPRTGTFQQFDGQTTLQKTSDNMIADFAVNALNPFTGLTGFADTKTYQPLAGGENLQYSNFSGGLLSGMIGENLVPFSELEARNAQVGGDGGGSDQPLIIPQEVAQTDPETGEPTAFPTFAPRRFEYQPYVGQFYTIPSRFTRPVSLLG